MRGVVGESPWEVSVRARSWGDEAAAGAFWGSLMEALWWAGCLSPRSEPPPLPSPPGSSGRSVGGGG